MVQQLIFECYRVFYILFSLLLSCFSELEEHRMDISTCSVDTMRMDRSRFATPDLNLGPHALSTYGAFSLPALRGFCLVCESLFGLKLPNVLRKSLSHV